MVAPGSSSDDQAIDHNPGGTTDEAKKTSSSSREEVILPGFRFHPTDEELVGYYLRYKVMQKPLAVEVITQLDIYKFDPWDLPKMSASGSKGEKDCYFFCPRDRKYRNSARPNRVTGAGFWKATGTDRPIYSTTSSSRSGGGELGPKCIGLKKSLVFYKGRAAKGVKTDWMMHEFRLPSDADPSSMMLHVQSEVSMERGVQPNAWALCRIFKKSTLAHRSISYSPASSQQQQQHGDWGIRAPAEYSNNTSALPVAMEADSGAVDHAYEQGLDRLSSHEQISEHTESAGTTKDMSARGQIGGHGENSKDAERGECTSNERPMRHVSGHSLQLQAAVPAELRPTVQQKFYAAAGNDILEQTRENDLLPHHNLHAEPRASSRSLLGPTTWVNVGGGRIMDAESINRGDDFLVAAQASRSQRGPDTSHEQMQPRMQQQHKVYNYNHTVETIDVKPKTLGLPELSSIHEQGYPSTSGTYHAAESKENRPNDGQRGELSSSLPGWTAKLPRMPSTGGMMVMDELVKTMETTVPTDGIHSPRSNNNGHSSTGSQLEIFNSFFAMESPVMKGALDFMNSINSFSSPGVSHHDGPPTMLSTSCNSTSSPGLLQASKTELEQVVRGPGQWRTANSHTNNLSNQMSTSSAGPNNLSSSLAFVRKEFSLPALEIPPTNWDLSPIFDSGSGSMPQRDLQ